MIERSCFALNLPCLGTGSAEGGGELGEVLGFDGAAGSIGLGIEIEDELASLEVRKRHFAAAVVGKPEAGCLAANRDLCWHAPSFRRFHRIKLNMAWGWGPVAAARGSMRNRWDARRIGWPTRCDL